MDKMKKMYDESSIESLDPLQFTRLRPGVYAGDTTYSTQLLVEIISNAVDEFRLGHGKVIDVYVSDTYCEVRDEGQGFIPNSFREDGKTILEAAFSVLNTSGKYREDGVYEGTSLGSFGIGSKITNFLSHSMMVQTRRDGKYEEIWFKEGMFESRDVGTVDPAMNWTHGTVVCWYPSEEFFTHTAVDRKYVKELLHTIVSLCPGLTINYNSEDTGEMISFYSSNGLHDLVDEAVEKEEIIKNRFAIDRADGKNKINIVATYTSRYTSTIVPYVNAGLTEKGTHITQIKTLLTRELNKFFREKKWLKEKDENLKGDDIQEGLYMVFNITSSGVAYNAQVKSNVVKIDMGNLMAIVAEELQSWCRMNEKDLKIIADKCLEARRVREATKKARENARNGGKKKASGLKNKMALSDKFVDCKSKDPSKRNLLLVEGLSAGGSVLESRNVETDCIYMLRGKVLSVLKSDVNKMLANQELSDIIRVVGAGFGKEFDISKMNFDKIVITADQDSDGMAIELLLIVFFFTYMRELVEQGKLYRAVTPLYIVTQKGKKEYLYTEQELAEWKATHAGAYDLAHCKGLGEISAQTLKEVCFEQQRYKRITVSDVAAAEELLEVLEGKSAEPRKQFIYENATRLGFNFM